MNALLGLKRTKKVRALISGISLTLLAFIFYISNLVNNTSSHDFSSQIEANALLSASAPSAAGRAQLAADDLQNKVDLTAPVNPQLTPEQILSTALDDLLLSLVDLDHGHPAKFGNRAINMLNSNPELLPVLISKLEGIDDPIVVEQLSIFIVDINEESSQIQKGVFFQKMQSELNTLPNAHQAKFLMALLNKYGSHDTQTMSNAMHYLESTPDQETLNSATLMLDPAKNISDSQAFTELNARVHQILPKNAFDDSQTFHTQYYSASMLNHWLTETDRYVEQFKALLTTKDPNLVIAGISGLAETPNSETQQALTQLAYNNTQRQSLRVFAIEQLLSEYSLPSNLHASLTTLKKTLENS